MKVLEKLEAIHRFILWKSLEDILDSLVKIMKILILKNIFQTKLVYSNLLKYILKKRNISESSKSNIKYNKFRGIET